MESPYLYFPTWNHCQSLSKRQDFQTSEHGQSTIIRAWWSSAWYNLSSFSLRHGKGIRGQHSGHHNAYRGQRPQYSDLDPIYGAGRLFRPFHPRHDMRTSATEDCFDLFTRVTKISQSKNCLRPLLQVVITRLQFCTARLSSTPLTASQYHLVDSYICPM